MEQFEKHLLWVVNGVQQSGTKATKMIIFTKGMNIYQKIYNWMAEQVAEERCPHPGTHRLIKMSCGAIREALALGSEWFPAVRNRGYKDYYLYKGHEQLPKDLQLDGGTGGRGKMSTSKQTLARRDVS